MEKVLLAALVAFLLVGGFWVQGRFEELIPAPVLQSYDGRQGIEDEVGVSPLRSRVDKLQVVANNRQSTLGGKENARDEAAKKYEFRREEYRTAMEAGGASAVQRGAFEKARASLSAAQAEIAPAKLIADEAAQGLAKERANFEAASARARDIFESRELQRSVKMFALHFGFAAGCVGIAWIVWQQGRQKRWRYLTILTALFTASVLQLLFLLFEYCWRLFLEAYAALGVSLLGTVVCILAIIGIKRWLFSPERLAESRLGASRCPLCSTPFTESQNHCWHCGHALVEDCETCGSRRLLYAPHCGNCGSSPS